MAAMGWDSSCTPEQPVSPCCSHQRQPPLAGRVRVRFWPEGEMRLAAEPVVEQVG